MTNEGVVKGVVAIDYTNHRGERGVRRIVPQRWDFMATPWHPEEQWIMTAFDLEKETPRQFAMKDIYSWTPVS